MFRSERLVVLIFATSPSFMVFKVSWGWVEVLGLMLGLREVCEAKI